MDPYFQSTRPKHVYFDGVNMEIYFKNLLVAHRNIERFTFELAFNRFSTERLTHFHSFSIPKNWIERNFFIAEEWNKYPPFLKKWNERDRGILLLWLRWHLSWQQCAVVSCLHHAYRCPSNREKNSRMSPRLPSVPSLFGCLFDTITVFCRVSILNQLLKLEFGILIESSEWVVRFFADFLTISIVKNHFFFVWHHRFKQIRECNFVADARGTWRSLFMFFLIDNKSWIFFSSKRNGRTGSIRYVQRVVYLHNAKSTGSGAMARWAL